MDAKRPSIIEAKQTGEMVIEDRNKVSRLIDQNSRYMEVQEILKIKNRNLQYINNEIKTNSSESKLMSREKAIKEIADLEKHAGDIKSEITGLKTYLKRRYPTMLSLEEESEDEEDD